MQQPVQEEEAAASPGPAKEASSRSVLGGVARFVKAHPTRVAQTVLLVLFAIVVLQNIEPTSIDVLFWRIASFPKLLLILLSMALGAVAWELVRRSFRR